MQNHVVVLQVRLIGVRFELLQHMPIHESFLSMVFFMVLMSMANINLLEIKENNYLLTIEWE